MEQPQLNTPLSDEYFPRHRDSALASVRPESSFLDFFRQSLIYTSPYCTNPGCCSFFPAADGIQEDACLLGRPEADSARTTDPELMYPLVKFEQLKDLPRVEVLQNFAQYFQSTLLKTVPFLADISCMRVKVNETPFYLLLPQALLGAGGFSDSQVQVSIEKLMDASSSLLIGAVEVDNSLGRTVTWFTAAILVLLFGSMQRDGQVWHQSELLNGCIQSTLFRPGFISHPNNHVADDVSSQNAIDADVQAMMKTYFVVDTVRTIHLRSPSTIQSTWSVCLSGYDFRTLYDSLILDQVPLPPELSNEEFLLLLISILSDINALSFSLGPLTNISSEVSSSIDNHCEERSPSSTAKASFYETSSKSEYSPFVPFTADHEYIRIKDKLAQSLDCWQVSFNCKNGRPAREIGVTEQTIWPLFHFVRLILVFGPTIYSLPSLAGYMPKDYDELPLGLKRPCQPHLVGIESNQSTLHLAMEILDSVNADSDSLQNQPRHKPIWYPIALFYASLVVWTHICGDLHGDGKTPLFRSSNVLLTPRRLLQMLHEELDKIKSDWTCAGDMAAVVLRLL